MIDILLEMGILLLVAFAVLATTIGSILRFGDKDRLFEATLQSMRWFGAGAVLASVADTISNGPTGEILVVGSIAVSGLILLEYYLSTLEDRHPD